MYYNIFGNNLCVYYYNRKSSKLRAVIHASPTDHTSASVKYGCRDSSSSNIGDCATSSSSASDSEVSVDDDDVDEARDSGCAAVPYGPTAASRLRFIVASEEKRRRRTDVELSAETSNQSQPGRQALL